MPIIKLDESQSFLTILDGNLPYSLEEYIIAAVGGEGYLQEWIGRVEKSNYG